jgi:hypothetical protein
MLGLHWWNGDCFVSHATVFGEAERRRELAHLIANWERVKVRMKEGLPFEKGGVFG